MNIRKNHGAPHRQFRFGTRDIAEATGRTPAAIRKDRQRGIVDPTSLVSLARYVMRYNDLNVGHGVSKASDK